MLYSQCLFFLNGDYIIMDKFRIIILTKKNLKPTSIGENVVCKSEVTKVSGKRIDFEVEVYKGSELVGAGKHIRFIINRSNFTEKLKS